MKYKDYTATIPKQYAGKEIEADACVELQDENDAQFFYDTAKERLLSVNKWHEVAGFVSAKFQVFDGDGNETQRNVHLGDYIRVDIPGPGSKEGEGYDWVFVEELKEISDSNVQSIGFRVRPAVNPVGNQEHIAHFYDDAATSNFTIIREGRKVIAIIIDRNIQPNDDTASVTDKLRHTVIGMSAINSFSKIQWQNLATGLVKRTE